MTLDVDRDPEAASRAPDSVSPPEGHPRFALLDGLRAVAALSVVIYHANQYAYGQEAPLGRFADHLSSGVAVFFVITGFLIYRPFLSAARGGPSALSVREFYRRRFLRIAPAYWVALLVLAPLLVFAHPLGLPNIAFIQIYSPEKWSRTGITPAWSLCVEVSFYALLPLFARVVHAGNRPSDRRLFIVLLALSLAAMGFRIWLKERDYFFTWWLLLPSTFPWFALGMALAVMSTSASRGPVRIGKWLGANPGPCAAVAAAILIVCGLNRDHAGEQADPLFLAYGAIAFLLVGPAVFAGTRTATARLLARRDVAWLGLISYGIYLYHYPLLGQIHKITRLQQSTFNLAIYGSLGVIASVACAALSYYLVERHALRLKHRGRALRREQSTLL